MKKKLLVSALMVVILAALTITVALADKPVSFDNQGNENGWVRSNCASIQDGTITASDGTPLTTGYDQYGCNYQAHMFNGTYDSVDRNLDGTYWGSTGDYVDDTLIMKWSDEWLANVDCNNDGKLDRGLVNGTSDGISKGWLTNHVEGDYIDTNGNPQHYTWFVKIGYTGPGSPLWGSYSVIEEVYNDPAGGLTGLYYKTDPGLGQFTH